MQRILVIGSAGSGKSMLSQRLSEQLQLPVIHLDKYYWKPDWVPTPRLKRADTVIFLDLSRWLCLYRIIKRRIKYHGKTRADLNKGCPEKLDWAFFIWVWNYKKKSRTRVMEQLNPYRDQKEIIIVKTRKEVKEITNQIRSRRDLD